MSRPISRLRALTLAVAALGLLAGCKDDAPSKPDASKVAPSKPDTSYAAISRPLRVASTGISLTQLDGTKVSLESLATEKVVVLVPWVRAQKDALTRVGNVRDALAGVKGVRVLPVIIDRASTPERMAEIAAMGTEAKLPLFIDADQTLIRFLVANMAARPSKPNVISVPSYAILTEGLRRVTYAPEVPDSTTKGVRALVDEALRTPLETAAPPAPTAPSIPAQPEAAKPEVAAPAAPVPAAPATAAPAAP